MGRGTSTGQTAVDPRRRGSVRGQAESTVGRADTERELNELRVVMQDQPRQYLDRLIAVSLAEDASEIGSIVSGYGMQMINQDDETVLANLDRGLNRFGDAWEQMPTGAKSITRLWARGRRREQIAEADEEMLNAAIQVKVCGDIARSRGLLPE